MVLSEVCSKPLFEPRSRCGLILRKRGAPRVPKTAAGKTARPGAHCDWLRRHHTASRAASIALHMEVVMDQETFNLSIRKFLKTVGVGSQREIEQAVAKAIAAGTIAGGEALPATMTLQIAGLRLEVRFDGEIKLQ